MSLPALARTWRFLVNQQSNAGGSLAASSALLALAIKKALCGVGAWTNSAGAGASAPATPWTVVASSNGTTANTSDNWITTADLIWNTPGSAHSWIVLQQTGIGATFQIVIGCESSGSNFTIKASHSGFGAAHGGVDGTTTTDPTALNSVTLLSTSNYGGPGSDGATMVHVMMSDDGASTRVVLCRNGQVCGSWVLDAPAAAETGWAHPYFGRVKGTNTLAPSSQLDTIQTLANPGTSPAQGFGTTAMNLIVCSEGLYQAELAETLSGANAFSGNRPLFGLGIASTTSGNVGRHGVIADLYQGLTNVATGSAYPSDGSRQFVQFDLLVFPWNGTVPLVSTS